MYLIGTKMQLFSRKGHLILTDLKSDNILTSLQLLLGELALVGIALLDADHGSGKSLLLCLAAQLVQCRLHLGQVL